MIPAQELEGKDLATVVRVLIANSQYMRIKGGRFECDWKEIVFHQHVE